MDAKEPSTDGADAPPASHRPRVVVAVGNQVVAAGIAQMVRDAGLPQEAGSDTAAAIAGATAEPGSVLVVALDELDDETTPLLRAATERGVKVLVLVDEDLEELHRLRGARCGGFAHMRDLSSDGLETVLRRTLDGEMPMPPDVAHFLVEVASHAREAAESAGRVRLTPREQETLQLLVDGLSNKQIARRLGISGHGAKRLVANILAKLDAPNRTIAVAKVLREGVVEL